MIDTVTGFLDGLPAWQATVLLVGASVLSAIAIEVVGVGLVRRAAGRTESAIDDILVDELRLPIVVTVALAGVYLLTRTPAVSATVMGQEELDLFFGTPSLSVILVTWAWALNRIVNRVVAEILDAGKRYDFAPVFSNVWTLLVLAGTGFLLLRTWGIEITPLLGAAGIAGVAIGFAAKDTVANFFGGIALYFDDTYKLGDFVVLESGDAGTVVKIGIRSTTLRTRSEVLVTVPNSMLNAGKIVNQSAPQRRKRIKLPLAVAYGTDLDAFESIPLDVAAEEELVLDRPEPRMRFRSFGDSALEYELLCWVASPTREGKARHRLNRAIYAGLADADIEIPFPQRDVTLRASTEEAVDAPPGVEENAAPEPGEPRRG